MYNIDMSKVKDIVSKQYGQSVFLTDEENALTKELLAAGIKIFMQQTPSNKEEMLNL